MSKAEPDHRASLRLEQGQGQRERTCGDEAGCHPYHLHALDARHERDDSATPIVMVAVSDPVRQGIIEPREARAGTSRERPGRRTC